MSVRILMGPLPRRRCIRSPRAAQPTVVPPAPVAPALDAAVTNVTPLLDDESWMLSGKSGVIHATVSPP